MTWGIWRMHHWKPKVNWNEPVVLIRKPLLSQICTEINKINDKNLGKTCFVGDFIPAQLGQFTASYPTHQHCWGWKMTKFTVNHQPQSTIFMRAWGKRFVEYNLREQSCLIHTNNMTRGNIDAICIPHNVKMSISKWITGICWTSDVAKTRHSTAKSCTFLWNILHMHTKKVKQDIIFQLIYM